MPTAKPAAEVLGVDEILDENELSDANEGVEPGVEVVETENGLVRVRHMKSKNVRERATALMEPEILNRVRNVVWWTRSTMQDFISNSVLAALEHAEKANGGPYKQAEGPLKTGRRVN